MKACTPSQQANPVTNRHQHSPTNTLGTTGTAGPFHPWQQQYRPPNCLGLSAPYLLQHVIGYARAAPRAATAASRSTLVINASAASFSKVAERFVPQAQRLCAWIASIVARQGCVRQRVCGCLCCQRAVEQHTCTCGHQPQCSSCRSCLHLSSEFWL